MHGVISYFNGKMIEEVPTMFSSLGHYWMVVCCK